MPLSFSEFPAVTKKDWQNAILKELKGKPLEALDWQIAPELVISPLYSEEDFERFFDPIPRAAGWQIGEQIPADDTSANEILLRALEGGVNSPELIFENLPSPTHFAALLEGVDLHMIAPVFHLPKGVEMSFLTMLRDYLNEKDYAPSELTGAVIFQNIASNPPELRQFYAEMEGLLPKFHCLHIDGRAAWEGSEHVVDELVSILKPGAQLLDNLQVDTINLAKAASKIRLSVAVGTSYFVEIAKLRALQLLWANVLKAYGVEAPAPPFLDAHFPPQLQSDNAHSNMISATTQAMAAIIGCAQRLTVLPAESEATAFSRRIARNVQHLLQLESHMDKVSDPAAGSYYIEKLTDALCEQVWAKM